MLIFLLKCLPGEVACAQITAFQLPQRTHWSGGEGGEKKKKKEAERWKQAEIGEKRKNGGFCGE